MYLGEKEEEFTNLLVEIGTRKNVAKVLAFLANIPEATSRDIERGTNLRQPTVFNALRYLIEQSWIASWETDIKGRSLKMYRLSKPFHEIIDCIEKKEKEKAINQLALIQKLQYHLR